MSDRIVFRCEDSNRGPLASEATALQTEPQPLPKQLRICVDHSKENRESDLCQRFMAQMVLLFQSKLLSSRPQLRGKEVGSGL